MRHCPECHSPFISEEEMFASEIELLNFTKEFGFAFTFYIKLMDTLGTWYKCEHCNKRWFELK